jgi:hypothetical protein
MAVALTGLPAAFVSFQQQQASQPPDKNVDSAGFSLLSAVQFSGNNAILAANVVTTATFTTF